MPVEVRTLDAGSLVDRPFESYVLRQCLAASNWALVYAGETSRGNELAVLKIAHEPRVGYDRWSRPVTEPGTPMVPDFSATRICTELKVISVGIVGDAVPDRRHLLLRQAQTLLAVESPALVKARRFVWESDYCILELDHLPGSDLRQMMGSSRRLPLNLIVSLARAMQRLRADRYFTYHGDLKPENVIWTGDDIVCIDPGYFGNLELEGGIRSQVCVTTPAYYPFLHPDDLFALGLIAFECICGVHPLHNGPSSAEYADLKRVTPALAAWVRTGERVGRYGLAPILGIQDPRILRPEIPPGLQDALLNGLRMRLLPDGRLDVAAGFASFEAFADALEPFVDFDLAAPATDEPPRIIGLSEPLSAAETDEPPHFLGMPEPLSTAEMEVRELAERRREQQLLDRDRPRFLRTKAEAERGYAMSKFELARMYERGIGIEVDEDEALTWYRQAANSGVPGASEAVKRLETRQRPPI